MPKKCKKLTKEMFELILNNTKTTQSTIILNKKVISTHPNPISRKFRKFALTNKRPSFNPLKYKKSLTSNKQTKKRKKQPKLEGFDQTEAPTET